MSVISDVILSQGMTELKIDESLLEKKLAELEQARAWSPRVVSKLEALIRGTDEMALFRVNPIRFAREKSISEAEAIDLFLHAAKHGLFQMDWQLLCSGCGEVIVSFAALKSLKSNARCALCHQDRQASLDDYIEISFTVSASLREIAFHHPERLPIETYFLNVFSSAGARLADGTPVAPLMRKIQRVLEWIEPRETREFAFDLAPGFLGGCDLVRRGELMFPVDQPPVADTQRHDVRLTDAGFQPVTAQLGPGKHVFRIENATERRCGLAMYHLPPDFQPYAIEYAPFLSGKRLLTTQTFKDLFASETIQGSQGLSVKELTFLFTDLKGSTEMYDRIGDLKAFSLVEQHFERLSRVIRQNNGAMVKTIGDAVMATFMTPADGVRAALAMLQEIRGFNEETGSREIVLKVGVHEGASIAVTLNERLDYFGQTVNVAARVQGLADADEIYVTDAVWAQPSVRELLTEFNVSPRSVRLKGIESEMKVHRITGCN